MTIVTGKPPLPAMEGRSPRPVAPEGARQLSRAGVRSGTDAGRPGQVDFGDWNVPKSIYEVATRLDNVGISRDEAEYLLNN